MSAQGRRLARGERLVVATHNAGKLAEFALLLHGRGIEVVGAGSLGLEEPDETEDSFAGNARLKARAAAGATGLPALADDSGFCVSALGGAPGIHSARWAGPERDFARAMRRVHEAVLASARPDDDAASFVCVLCLAWPDGGFESFEGQIGGALRWPPQGERGHGYDPVFRPEGHERRFSEMTEREKNAISHRARAFAAFAAACLPGGRPAPACPAAGQAARRLTRLSAIADSFWSVAFSSSRVCCSTLAQSWRPSCLANAISVP